MKKTLVLASLLAAFGASAQTSVTAFGVLDADFGKNKATTTSAANVVTVVTGSNFSREGRDYGLSGSRIGFKGTEALGGGMNAYFHTEHGADTNEGKLAQNSNGNGNASTSGRRTVVGANGAFGDVNFGREYTPLWAMTTGTIDKDGGTGEFSTATQHNGNAVRTSSAITYTTPALSGFAAKVQLAKDNGSVTTAGAAAAAAPAGTNALANPVATVKTVGLGVSYSAGPLYVAAASNTRTKSTWNNAAGTLGGTFNGGTLFLGGSPVLGGNNKQVDAAVGATYDLGVAKLHANYMSDTITLLGSTGSYKVTDLGLSVTVPFGAAYIMAGIGKNNIKNTLAGAAFAGKGTDTVVGAGYSLSARTDVYARIATNDNVKATNAGAANGSYKNSNYGFGLRHAF